jgi:hypothetical protein
MKNCSLTTTAPATDGWSRPAVTFRLTDERKRALRDLLDAPDVLASPTAALDMAIELATAGRNLGEAEVEDLPSNTEIAKMLDSLRAQIQALARAVEEWGEARTLPLRPAVAPIETNHAGARSKGRLARIGDDDINPVPISAWLDAEVSPSTTWLVAKILWIRKRPAGGGAALWDVELRELGRSGALTTQKDEAIHVALGPAPANGPLTRLEGGSTDVLSCARSGGGWALSLRTTFEDGKLGEPFAEISI